MSKNPFLNDRIPIWIFNHGPIYGKSFLTGKNLTFAPVQQEHFGNYTCYYEELDPQTFIHRYYITYVEIKVMGMHH